MKKKNRAPENEPEAPAYIDWAEFTHLLKRSPPPWKDSQGDSAVDEVQEAVMGEDFPPELLDRPEEIPVADRAADAGLLEEALDNEEQVEEGRGVRSSPRPDPVEDLESPSSTH